jgi:hypothetical protein
LVEQPPEEPSPPTPRLDAPRPNPFRQSAQIPFALSVGGHVRIAVYDTRGREIAVLENGNRPVGNYLAVWNGRNRSGRPVGTGVYYVGAKLPGGVALTQKIVKIR